MKTTTFAQALLVTYGSATQLRSAKRADDNWPIKIGYVHFGDSFAAGMGTGTTSTDACRVGSNNYGALIKGWMNNPDLDYQERACSGDTTVGLNRQIDEWSSPEKADLATLTMGGNDLGFSDLVWYCVITPNNAANPWTTAAKCSQAMLDARNILVDGSDNGLDAKLRSAYDRILEKSGRADFHLYVAGYPEFFNQDDEDCNQSSFHYWFGGYQPAWDPRIVRLSRMLRGQLNELVLQLNSVVESAVNAVNDQHSSSQVHYVDVNEKFKRGHRWCEGDTHEPDETRTDTWFFLSSWDDVPPFDSALVGGVATLAEAVSEANQINSLTASGHFNLPDADSCDSDLGTDPDPWAHWLCRVSEDVALDANGDWGRTLAAANAEIATGNVSAQHIPYFVPTRQIKTFHPRSPGMVAYRDAVIEAINRYQTNA